MRWLFFGCCLVSAMAVAQPQTIDIKTLRALQGAQNAQQQGNLDKAEKILASVEAEPGSYSQALLWRTQGYLAWQKAQNANALQLLEKSYNSKLLEQDQLREDALALGKLCLQLDKPKKAINYLQQANESNERLELSIYAWQMQGRYDRALPLAEKYLASQSQISDQWLSFMVGANAEQKRYAQAEKWQKRLLARHPLQVGHWRQLAGIQQMGGDYARSFATLRTAYQQGLKFSEADLDQLVALASAAQQPWQGARLLESLMKQGHLPVTAAREERLAQLQLQSREKGQALKQYQKLARKSQKPGHWLTVVQLASEQENWDVAREALQAAAKSGASRKQVRSWQDWLEMSTAVN